MQQQRNYRRKKAKEKAKQESAAAAAKVKKKQQARVKVEEPDENKVYDGVESQSLIAARTIRTAAHQNFHLCTAL